MLIPIKETPEGVTFLNLLAAETIEFKASLNTIKSAVLTMPDGTTRDLDEKAAGLAWLSLHPQQAQRIVRPN
jgi:hypothetical protein